MKFRKRPVEVDAWHFELGAPRPQWLEDAITRGDVFIFQDDDGVIDRMTIATLEGNMAASPGDYIVKGVQGELYAVKSHIFEATYDEAMAPTVETGPAPVQPMKAGA